MATWINGTVYNPAEEGRRRRASYHHHHRRHRCGLKITDKLRYLSLFILFVIIESNSNLQDTVNNGLELYLPQSELGLEFLKKTKTK